MFSFYSNLQIRLERTKTSILIVMYYLYLYFLDGLSLRDIYKTLVVFKEEGQRNYVSIRN